MESLNVGTKEVVSVLLSDKLQTIDTIPDADFKVITEDETVTVKDWATVENITGLRIDVMLDTTTGAGESGTDPWPEGVYKLYVRPAVSPEAPIVGPFEFGLS